MEAGTLVADRFLIERAAGAGAMGAVFRAIDRVTNEPVALKILLQDNPVFVERFMREATLLSELRHPRIVRYVAHGVDRDGRKFLAMEWLEGIDVEQLLATRGVTIDEAVRLAHHIGEALAAVHARNVVHRDLKPSNIYLPGGRLDEAKLLDFGIARMGQSARAMTAAGMLVGTPGYMSPEQARGSDDVDARSDIFSLGCILFECITGRWAFEGEHLTALLTKILVSQPARLSDMRDDVPAELDALVDRMLSKDREKRPRDARALLELLDAIAPIGDSAVRSPSVPPPAITSGERRIVSIVLVDRRGSAGTLSGATRRDTLETEPAAGQRPADEADEVAALRQAAAPFGARIETLANGNLVALMGGAGAAIDQAVQAARCALAMRAVAADAPMALATGRGEMHTVMGAEVIDRAATLVRTSGKAASDTVVVDDMTASLLESRFIVLGTHAPRKLIGEREGEEGRRLLGQPTVMVGRDREMAALEASFHECVNESAARAVVITGAAGVGKSRLRDEFVRRMRAAYPALEVWSARGDSASAGAPFMLVVQLVRVVFGLHDGEPPEQRRVKVRVRIEREVARDEQERVTELACEMAGAPVTDPSVSLQTARQDPMVMGDQLRRAWEDLVVAAAAHRPLAIVLEDLQWGDLPSVKFIDAALRAAVDRPLFVAAFGRPEVNDLFPKLWAARGVQSTALAELSRRSSERLVRNVLGETVDAELLARIVERGGGNAFYLEELIRAVSRGAGDELPETVLAMVQGRVESLDAESRRVLRAASVYGQIFWTGGVRVLLGKSRSVAGGLDQWLADLQEREIIVPREGSRFPGEKEYAFRHAPLRDAAYEMLTDDDRALGHRLAGEWLERAGERSAAVLADHFERGRDSMRAVRWYLRAAERALAGNDFRTAVEAASNGIRAGAIGDDLAQLHNLAGEAERWQGDLEKTEQHAADALAIASRGTDRWFEAARLMVVSAGPSGHLAAAYDIGQQLLDVRVEEVTPIQIVTMLMAAAQLRRTVRRELGDALRTRVDSIAGDLATKDPIVMARLERTRALEKGGAGDVYACLQHQMRSVEAYELAGDLRSAALIRPDVGFAFSELGLFEDAERTLRRALADAQQFGLQAAIAGSQHNLGMVLARLGQIEAGEKLQWEALRHYTATGNKRLEGGTRAYLAEILLLGDKVQGAEREARNAVESLDAHPPLRAFALGVLSRVRLARGATLEALEAAGEALKLAERGAETNDIGLRVRYAEALLATGARDEARDIVVRAKEVLENRAAQIADLAVRVKYLTAVPDHARVFEMANELDG